MGQSFPDGFVWGAASASYQIEGAAFEDGRGLSVWDTAARRPGFTFEGQTGDVACDAYHRYEEDVKLMADLGLKGYRFSIAWPRVLPEGIGKANEKGLAYYDRLIDTLLKHDVEPWVTIFHWDYPQALFERGGWFSPDSPKWFADYTKLLAERYTDRVTHWFTQNEPQCYLGLGHRDGAHAPGFKFGDRQTLRAIYHSSLAHGESVMALRAHAKRPVQVGMAPCGYIFHPADPDNPRDVEAARRQTFALQPGDGWIWSVSLYLDPLLLGSYPYNLAERFGENAPTVTDADLRTMHQPVDFLGFNFYSGGRVVADEQGEPKVTGYGPGHPRTCFNWPVTPECFYWCVKLLQERYRRPIVITENGCASMDWVHADGKVHDPGRIDFLTRYLSELRRAIADGVDVRGYFQWALTDNFEWAEGFNKRFGLVYMDYATQQRIPKDSFDWYKRTIAANGANLPDRIAPLR